MGHRIGLLGDYKSWFSLSLFFLYSSHSPPRGFKTKGKRPFYRLTLTTQDTTTINRQSPLPLSFATRHSLWLPSWHLTPSCHHPDVTFVNQFGRVLRELIYRQHRTWRDVETPSPFHMIHVLSIKLSLSRNIIILHIFTIP